MAVPPVDAALKGAVRSALKLLRTMHARLLVSRLPRHSRLGMDGLLKAENVKQLQAWN